MKYKHCEFAGSAQELEEIVNHQDTKDWYFRSDITTEDNIGSKVIQAADKVLVKLSIGK